MQLKRCPNGHYYDVEKASSCPHCAGGMGVSDDVRTASHASAAGASAPQAPWGQGDPGPTVAQGAGRLPAAGDPGPTVPHRPVDDSRAEAKKDDQRTMGMMQRSVGMDPVVGWLVCVDGTDRGHDFHLHGERNFIGRSDSADVHLTDPAVSRETHATVSYNPRHNIFRLMPGDGKGIVYLNGDEVLSPMELKPYDSIELGQSKLLFIPFCCESFVWQ